MGKRIQASASHNAITTGLPNPKPVKLSSNLADEAAFADHGYNNPDQWSSLRFYMRDGPFERSALVATYLLTRAAQNGQPTATFKLAELLAAEAPEDIPVIIDAAALASLAYRELPAGEMKSKAKLLRDKLLGLLDTKEKNVVLNRTINWPNC